jgi:hypothetical protein
MPCPLLRKQKSYINDPIKEKISKMQCQKPLVCFVLKEKIVAKRQSKTYACQKGQQEPSLHEENS